MLLVYGDVTRSVWYFVFSIYTSVRGAVASESKLCQTSGFFIQYGTETSGTSKTYHIEHVSDLLPDYAVLLIAVHSALQIFRPASRGTSDGLYDYRYYLFSAGIVLPVIMAGLAFLNPGPAYESLGAFCQLPIRPIWYRLALSWIPRYIISIVIVGLAGAIYAYVGCEFRSYANPSGLQTPMTTTMGLSRHDGDVETADKDLERRMTESEPVYPRRASSIAHDVVSAQQKEQGVAFGPTTYLPIPPTPEICVNSQALSESSTDFPLKRSASARPRLHVVRSGYAMKASPPVLDLQGPLSPHSRPTQDPLANLTPTTSNPPPSTIPDDRERPSISPTESRPKSQRRRINRQLRLLFVYPLAYTLMWLLPFVHHSMNYSDYWANHPVWLIRFGQTLCFCSMGFIDCLVFCMRERPWRKIQSSDGTIWGSLAVWRTSRNSFAESNGTATRMRGDGSITRERSMTESAHERVSRARQSVRTSASDDKTRIAAGQARKRLDLEKVERLAEFRSRSLKGKEKMDV
jgi:hypothetical protein